MGLLLAVLLRVCCGDAFAYLCAFGGLDGNTLGYWKKYSFLCEGNSPYASPAQESHPAPPGGASSSLSPFVPSVSGGLWRNGSGN